MQCRFISWKDSTSSFLRISSIIAERSPSASQISELCKKETRTSVRHQINHLQKVHCVFSQVLSYAEALALGLAMRYSTSVSFNICAMTIGVDKVSIHSYPLKFLIHELTSTFRASSSCEEKKYGL